jgi:hypothetical protein
LDEFSETWPRAGMTRSGIAYLLRPLAPLTGGTGFGSLPTPAAKEGGYNQSPSAGATVRPSLQTMARRGLWPTPHGMPKPGQHRRPGPSGNELGRGVNEAERIPTPTAGDAKSTRNATANRSNPDSKRHHSGVTLTDFVTMEQFKTPTESDAKHGQGSVGRSASLCSQVNEQSGGRGALNPTWVEWLMGFPLGWTALPLSATPSSRRSRSGSGDASSTSSEAA